MSAAHSTFCDGAVIDLGLTAELWEVAGAGPPPSEQPARNVSPGTTMFLSPAVTFADCPFDDKIIARHGSLRGGHDGGEWISQDIKPDMKMAGDRAPPRADETAWIVKQPQPTYRILPEDPISRPPGPVNLPVKKAVVTFYCVHDNGRRCDMDAAFRRKRSVYEEVSVPPPSYQATSDENLGSCL
ncbi:hypothetical protein FRB94_002346 [Tulasnella sp. JGI-2019a]|nr:hypothetical protein FRB94_002346 [Tulasnella sp. JGI-2019a]KAG9035255.1 hypothetical protein FRB95_011698 [Tulasnella sp. JGI-2019a]